MMNKGFVIANDTDMKRAYLLTHQARRLNSPALFVTNNDARFFPNLRINQKQQNLKFDRILCDVPCSGDGTFRKNLGLWKNFHAHMGHANHPLQLDILERGIKLLKKGGRMIYSTCSFNPIENEAVVACAVSRHLKQIKIVDVSKEVSPFLRYRPGLTKWKVYHKGKGERHPAEYYTRYEDVPEPRRKMVKESMFTDTYTLHNNDPDRIEGTPDADPLGLKHCMRFYPHDDNQGGFFVCVLEKIWDEEDGIILDTDYKMDAWSNDRVRQKGIMEDLNDFVKEFEDIIKQQEEESGEKQDDTELNIMKELVQQEKQTDSVQMYSLNDQLIAQKFEEENQEFAFVRLLEHKPELWSQIQDFFGIDESKFSCDQLVFQQDTTNNILLFGPGLIELLNYRRKNKLTTIVMGLKVFSKNKGNQVSACNFRLRMDGLEVILPYMSNKRVIQSTKEVFEHLTKQKEMSENFETLKKMGLEGAQEIGVGSAVLKFDTFAVTIWIGINSVSLMVGKEEINSIVSLMQ